MKKLYLLYLLLIPLFRVFDIQMPFHFISTFVALLGVLFHLLGDVEHKITPFGKWSKFFMFLIVYTIMSALLSYNTWGVVNGETTMDCILGTCAFIFTLWTSLYFNYLCLSKYVSLDDVSKILKAQNYMLLVIGFVQLLILYGIAEQLTEVYDLIASATCIVDSSFLTYVNRGVCLFGSEPSSATFALMTAVPFALMYEYNKRMKPMTICWLVILGLSGSSQTMISLLIVLVCYMLLKVCRKIPSWIYLGAFGLGMMIALFYTFSDGISIAANEGSLGYVIYGKALNFGDYSVMAREATVINDMKIFFSHPLTGIGDGIQGMLYNQNVPNWCRYSSEVDDIVSGVKGVANGGGNFFPAFLSGYGIIGLLFLIPLLRKYATDVRKLGTSFFWNNVCRIGFVLFLIVSWQTVSIFNDEFMVFVLALPYAAINPQNQKYFSQQ